MAQQHNLDIPPAEVDEIIDRVMDIDPMRVMQHPKVLAWLRQPSHLSEGIGFDPLLLIQEMFHVSPERMRSRSRLRHVVNMRQLVAAAMIEPPVSATHTQIGKALNRDRTTVINLLDNHAHAVQYPSVYKDYLILWKQYRYEFRKRVGVEEEAYA